MTQADRPSIEITQDADWRRLIDRNLTTVVDPMVLRAGEIFMRGRSGQAFGGAPMSPLDAAAAENFLDKNLLALGFFFDALILNDQLSVFNYGDSYDMHLDFTQRSFAVFNDAGIPALVPVNVTRDAYLPIKQRALTALRIGMGTHDATGGPWLPLAEAQAISNELADAEYRWNIALGPELDALLPTDLDRQLGRFLLGGMIFGEYADHLQSEHWLQPKRARLFAQVVTGGRTPDRNDEEQLFAWLAQKYQLPALSCWQPTFFHAVLAKATSLRDIPRLVDTLRRSRAVADYCAWRTQALAQWRTKGGLDAQSLKTIERLRKALTTNGSNFAGAGDAGVAWVETAVKWSPDSAAKAVAKTVPIVELGARRAARPTSRQIARQQPSRQGPLSANRT